MLQLPGFVSSIFHAWRGSAGQQSLFRRLIVVEYPRLCEKPRPVPFLDAIPVSALRAHFRCRNLPEGLEFRKVFFGQSPLHQADGMDVAKICIRMSVMDGRDKRDAPAKPKLHLTDGQTRDGV